MKRKNLSAAELAAMWGVSTATVRRYVVEGMPVHHYTDPSDRYPNGIARFDLDEIEPYFAERGRMAARGRAS